MNLIIDKYLHILYKVFMKLKFYGDKMAQRNRMIYEKYKTGEYSMEMIGSICGISKQRVSKIIQRQVQLLTRIDK